MTPSPDYLARLRVAIAEADGYERQVRCEVWWNRSLGKHFTASELPNYPAARDAIVEAILRRFVTEAKMGIFLHQFQIRQDNIPDIFALATATALQLATAYARAASLDVPEGNETNRET